MSNVSLGSDIEEFVVDNNGQIIPVCGLVGGTKMRPLSTPNGAVQEDNVAIEYNPRPATTEDEWVRNIKAARQDARDLLAKKGFSTIAKSSHHFTKEILSACGRRAMTFGCAPDSNIHSSFSSPPPSPFQTLRTAAGHIHFGSGTDIELAKRIVQWCDYLLGVPSLILDPDRERRTMYGRAGCYRIKVKGSDSYDGVEYRTLGNWWVDDEPTIRWVWRQAQKAYENALADRRVPLLQEYCINTYDICYANAMITRRNMDMP